MRGLAVIAVLGACAIAQAGCSSGSGAVELVVDPLTVPPGGSVAVTVTSLPGGERPIANTTELERLRDGIWVPIYILVSRRAGSSRAIPLRGSTRAPRSHPLPAGATEHLTIPGSLAPGDYRLAKGVHLRGADPFEVTSIITVAGAPDA